MRKVHLDFESRSRVDIWSSGAYVYASDSSTEIMCLAYAVDNGPVRLIRKCRLDMYPLIDPFEELRKLATADDTLFYAHNAIFERFIWRHKLTAFGLPEMPITKWRCTAAKALAHGLPKALKDVARVLKVGEQKDMGGRAVMLKVCKPKSDGTWNEDPELLKQLEDYCAQDVRTERDVDNVLPELSAHEQRIWFEDQLINERGIAVDKDAMEKCLELIDKETEYLKGQIATLTDGKLEGVSRRNAVLEYFKKNGVDLPDFTKATVESALRSGKIPARLAEILRIRQQLGLTSTAKYVALKQALCEDSRLRDTLLYHSASTGRWGGKLVQLQNLPRGTVKDTDEAIELIKTTDIETLRMLYGNIMGLLSSCIRGMFVAGEGKELIVADYSAIEARVLMWLAGQTDAVKMFSEGKDIYVEMARRIGQGATRQLGKQAVLGCFPCHTQVLTKNGFRRIVDIKEGEWVWNGAEWVQTSGVVYRGKKKMLRVFGQQMTPDHRVLTPKKWVYAYQVARENIRFQQSVLSLGSLRLRDIKLERGVGLRVFTSVALAGLQNILCLAIACIKEKAQDVISVLKKPRGIGPNTIGGTQTLCPMTTTGAVFSTELVPSSVGAPTLSQKFSTITGDVVSKFIRLGSRTAETFYNTLSHYLGGIDQNFKSTEKMWIKAMCRATLGFVQRGITCLINVVSMIERTQSNSSSEKTDAYDLLFCGSKNRFTILTPQGLLIVHNCGFGMGHAKFQATCKGYGIDIDSALAEKAVAAYRNTFSRVPQLWYSTEQAMRTAIETKKDYGIFKWGGEFLYMVLPSGRKIAYHKAHIKDGRVCYFTTNSMTKKYERNETYGGRLVENLVQATARDIMAWAMVRAEKEGYNIVLTVHDELVAEGTKSLEEFIKILTHVPKWAEGCPISAEGWVGRRYKK